MNPEDKHAREFPEKSSDLLAFLVGAYSADEIGTLVLAGDDRRAIALAGKRELIAELIEWQADTESLSLEDE